MTRSITVVRPPVTAEASPGASVPAGVDLTDGYGAEQLRAAERPLLDAGEPLMARAAAGLAAEVRRRLAARGRDAARPGHVVLLVGSGSNGGDALVAGAALADEGHRVTVVPVGSRVHEAGAAAATGAGAVTSDPGDWSDPASARLRLRGVDVVVDGVLGTGTSADPALRGTAAEVVAALRDALAADRAGAEWAGAGAGDAEADAGADGARARAGADDAAAGDDAGDVSAPPVVVACDLPSGTGPDDGSVPVDVVLPAAVTVTFGACCAGLLLRPARDLAGDVVVVDIGLGPELAGVEPLVRR